MTTQTTIDGMFADNGQGTCWYWGFQMDCRTAELRVNSYLRRQQAARDSAYAKDHPLCHSEWCYGISNYFEPREFNYWDHKYDIAEAEVAP